MYSKAEPIDKNRIKNKHTAFLFSHSISSPFCDKLTACISDTMNKAGTCGYSITRHEPALICFSLVESEPLWLRPEELKFEAENVFLSHEYRQKNQLMTPVDGDDCTK